MSYKLVLKFPELDFFSLAFFPINDIWDDNTTHESMSLLFDVFFILFLKLLEQKQLENNRNKSNDVHMCRVLTVAQRHKKY